MWIRMNPNPFALDGIIRILLEEADIPTLKILREINANWNCLDLKELEIRALEGKFCELYFTWGPRNDDKTFEDVKEDLANFLEATTTIPQLFRDFQLHFRQSLIILNDSFFTKYPPIFIQLDIYWYFSFDEDTSKLLLNFFNLVAPTLQELYVKPAWTELNPSWTPKLTLNSPKGQLLFPKLKKFNTANNFKFGEMFSQFWTILDNDGEINPAPNLKQLSIGKLSTDFGTLLGFDIELKFDLYGWSTLTHLTLYTHLNNRLDVSKITKLLSTLAQNGMTLSHLDLDLRWKYKILGNSMCRLLSKFFHSQSQTLQYLCISFSIYLATSITNNIPQEDLQESGYSIRIPIFPQVIKLKFGCLNIVVDGVRQIPFQMGSFLSHFPKLKDLELHHPHLIRALVGNDNLSLRELIFYDINIDNPFENPLDWLKMNFNSVLRFEYLSLEINNNLELLPWGNSLEYLRIYNVLAPLKLGHLTHLKYLVVLQFFIPNSTNSYRKSVHSYLDYFSDVLQLNLTTIYFRSRNKICDEDKGHIRSYFPFQVEFPEPWV